MKKKTTVIDASVLLTALIGIKNTIGENLRRLLQDKSQNVITLPFAAIEYANGIRFSLRDTTLAHDALEAYGKLQLGMSDFTFDDVKATLDLSYRCGTTAYDTAYHHVALLFDGTFITCDKDYYQKASHLGHIQFWD